MKIEISEHEAWLLVDVLEDAKRVLQGESYWRDPDDVRTFAVLIARINEELMKNTHYSDGSCCTPQTDR